MSLLGKKLYLGIMVLAFFLMFIPLVNAFDVEGAVNFVGNGGGNVTFNQNFSANVLTWGNGINRFAGFRWGGNNFGNVGFDADAGTNMTVLIVTETQIRYNISNPAAGASTQRIFYGNKFEPQITGGVITNFNPATDIVTVQTNGDADVTLSWNGVSTILTNIGSVLVGIFLVTAIIVALNWENGMNLKTGILITFLIIITLVMAFAAIFRSWGA